MPRINTRAGLREYIKRQLGAPNQVELTEDHLNDCIDIAIERYSEYASDGTTDMSLLVQTEKDKFDYILPDYVRAVTNLMASTSYQTFLKVPSGYTLALHPINLNYMSNLTTIDLQGMAQKMSQISTMREMFDVTPNYSYNSNKKLLRFFENVESSLMLLEVSLEYMPDEVKDDIFGHFWIKKRAVGEAFVLLSTRVGKYDSNLISGSRINYTDMENKGYRYIEETEEEIYDLMDPLGIYVF